MNTSDGLWDTRLWVKPACRGPGRDDGSALKRLDATGDDLLVQIHELHYVSFDGEACGELFPGTT